jgi:hypothetical protein
VSAEVAESAAQVVDPGVGDLPGDEVAAALVRGEVDVVVPVGAVAGQPVLDPLLGGGDAGRVLVADECDAGGCL